MACIVCHVVENAGELSHSDAACFAVATATIDGGKATIEDMCIKHQEMTIEAIVAYQEAKSEEQRLCKP